MDNISLLKDGFNQMGLSVNEEVINELITFKDVLLEWNEKINLTTITDEREFYIKHLLDSSTCMLTNKIVDNANIIDVGTGAGFPGIPIKIINKGVKLTLLDSLNKRISYLNDVIERLKMENVKTVHARAEEAGVNKLYREKYDVVLSRAVAALNILSEYCIPFVKKGGFFICQKGPSYAEEVKEADNAIKMLGGSVINVEEYSLPFSDIKHYIIIIEKVRETPTKYPRKPGKPAANPIV